MLCSTPGFVLHTTPYGETSVIARVFTRQLGVKPYIVKGVRTTNGRLKQNLLQPLSHLDMVVYESPHANINHIKEMTPADNNLNPPSSTTHTELDEIRKAIRFFVCEALYKGLRDEEPSPALFDFVSQTLDEINHRTQSLAHHPIVFLIGLANHLGILPLNNYSQTEPYFNITEGRFESYSTPATLMSQRLSLLLHHYIDTALCGHQPPVTSADERKAILDYLISYLHHHIASFGSFKSHEVLHAVLR